MPVLEWDKLGSRVYETGVDRGVLYLDEGVAIPWNGLTSVVEKSNTTVTAVYYDGMKINDIISPGVFSATLKAFTYPDEFMEIDGYGKLNDGLFVSDQPPKPFSLSYRTQISNDVDGLFGYKIHILYNCWVDPSDRTHVTTAGTLAPVEFEWAITAVPEDLPNMRPTAHIIIDSTDFAPGLLAEIEEILYGSDDAFPGLIPMADLIAFMGEWYRDNPPPPPLIDIEDLGDGTWTATTTDSSLVVDHGDGTFTIYDATADIAGDIYHISDTP